MCQVVFCDTVKCFLVVRFCFVCMKPCVVLCSPSKRYSSPYWHMSVVQFWIIISTCSFSVNLPEYTLKKGIKCPCGKNKVIDGSAVLCFYFVYSLPHLILKLYMRELSKLFLIWFV